MRVTGSPCGHSQGPQGSAPGNELTEHLVNGFLMVRGRLELCVILEVGDQRECDLINDALSTRSGGTRIPDCADYRERSDCASVKKMP